MRRYVIDLGKGDEDDYNQIAWEGLFRDERTAQTVEAAEHAALFRNQPSRGHLHTLAAVYADVGRVVEARQTLIEELDARGFAGAGTAGMAGYREARGTVRGQRACAGCLSARD